MIIIKIRVCIFRAIASTSMYVHTYYLARVKLKKEKLRCGKRRKKTQKTHYTPLWKREHVKCTNDVESMYEYVLCVPVPVLMPTKPPSGHPTTKSPKPPIVHITSIPLTSSTRTHRKFNPHRNCFSSFFHFIINTTTISPPCIRNPPTPQTIHLIDFQLPQFIHSTHFYYPETHC